MLIQSQAERNARRRDTPRSLPSRRSTWAQPAEGRPGPSVDIDDDDYDDDDDDNDDDTVDDDDDCGDDDDDDDEKVRMKSC